MPRKSAKPKANLASYKLINLDFSYDERKQVRVFITDMVTSTSDAMLQIVDAGFKFSVSYDEYHECYIGSLTHKASSSKTKPVYTYKHNDFETLLAIAFYIFVILLVRGDAELAQENTDLDW